jgi:toxin ParE1/3/4
MSNRSFEFHPEAIGEAWDAFHWYASRSIRAGDNFWDEISLARTAVTRRPESWPLYLHGARIYSFEKYPFGLVYIERGDRIIGVAVAHLKRRPGYWRTRLPE